jgi:pSer/pThr/pTyr-binding forkhead associated (FHA) protein
VDVTLEIKRGSKKTRAIRLRREETLVGRQEGCDMRIPSAAVSRKHCRLSFRDGYLRVEDLGSSNGTFLNGDRIEGIHPVKPGDLLEIGPITFLVKYELSRSAAGELLKHVLAEPADIVDVEPVDDEEIVDVSPVDDQKVTSQFNLAEIEAASKSPPQPKKTTPKKSPPPPPPEPEELSDADLSPGEVSEMFNAPLTIPVEDELRDLLAGLDDDKD